MAKQKVEIEVDVPEGWEFTGANPRREDRSNHGVHDTENGGRCVDSWMEVKPCLILRKVEPKRETRWWNLYPEGRPYAIGRNYYHSRGQADSESASGRISVLRMELENDIPVHVELEPA